MKHALASASEHFIVAASAAYESSTRAELYVVITRACFHSSLAASCFYKIVTGSCFYVGIDLNVVINPYMIPVAACRDVEGTQVGVWDI